VSRCMPSPARAAPKGLAALDNMRVAGLGPVAGRPMSAPVSGMLIGLGSHCLYSN
jgi:hypothetical protein